jgi:hypothetical protein
MYRDYASTNVLLLILYVFIRYVYHVSFQHVFSLPQTQAVINAFRIRRHQAFRCLLVPFGLLFDSQLRIQLALACSRLLITPSSFTQVWRYLFHVLSTS